MSTIFSELETLKARAKVDDNWLKRWVVFLPSSGIPCLALKIDSWVAKKVNDKWRLVGIGRVGGDTLFKLGWKKFELSYLEQSEQWSLRVVRTHKGNGRDNRFESKGILQSPFDHSTERLHSVKAGAFS